MTPQDLLSATFSSTCDSADVSRFSSGTSVRCSSISEYSARLVRETTHSKDDHSRTNRLGRRVSSLSVISVPFHTEETELSIGNTLESIVQTKKADNHKVPEVETYLKACHSMHLKPATSLCHQLETGSQHISLGNRKLGCPGVKALTVALKENTKVTSVDIRGNAIGIQGARAVADMLSTNTTIHSLDLAENNLEATGLSALCTALQDQATITSIDISDNQVGDKDGKIFSDLILTCSSVRSLKISHNHINDATVRSIALALLHSSLRELDLSWNHITHMGISYLCRALQHNISLVHLDVSWNGIGPQGCRDVARMLSCNTCLEWLDLSANRINLAGLILVTRALARNTRLLNLNIASNLLTTAGAATLLQHLVESSNFTLQQFHLGNTTVDDNFLEILDKLQSQGHSIQVTHGPVIPTYSQMSAKLFLPPKGHVTLSDPMTQLLTFMRKRSLRVIDLFRTLDRNQNEVISRREIKRAFEYNVQKTLTVDGLDHLMRRLDFDGDGHVTYIDMVNAQRKFNRTIALRRQMERLQPKLPKRDTFLNLND